MREGTITHDGNKDLTRHLGNARRQDLSQRDEQGKAIWLIRKERPDSPHKIDLAMAAVSELGSPHGCDRGGREDRECV